MKEEGEGRKEDQHQQQASHVPRSPFNPASLKIKV